MMAAPGGEKELRTTDPIGAVNATNTREPLATEDEQAYVEKLESGNASGSSRGGDGDADADDADAEAAPKPQKLDLKQTKSYATSASGLSRTESNIIEAKPKPWHKKLNPLRWGAVAPVPKEKGASREYKAGFFSQLTFQWMAPLMHVSIFSRNPSENLWCMFSHVAGADC